MRFARPDVLWATFLVMPILGGFLWWSWRERQRLITQFVQSRLLAILTVGVSRQRQKLRLWLVALAVIFAMVALSRPQWGFGYQEVKQKGLDILIAIDTSRSMLAEDTPPNRLARAKLAALDLRRLAKTDRLGLIAFAGSAFLQMPLSTDEDAFRQNLDALDTSLLPQGGTALAEAIQTAKAAFKEGGRENHRALILFTDGEDHDGEAVEAAKSAAKDGLLVFTVGIGTAKGEILAIRDSKGRTEFIKDENGNAVKSRLNESLLQDIAKAGEGFYLPLSGAKTMETLFEQGLAPLPKMDLKASLMRQYFERYQWFLALAVLLLIAELFVPDRRPAARTATPAPSPVSAGARISLGMVLWIGLLLGLAPRVEASASAAKKSYDAGKYKNALTEYEHLMEANPNDTKLRYNAGAAAFQAGKFDKAQEHFASALATADSQLQQQAYYNLGNTRFRLGQESQDPKKAQDLWQKATEDYQSSLKLAPNDVDAKHNLEFVQKQLEELKKQQQQQQKKDGDSKDKNDSQDSKDSQDKDDKKKEGDSKKENDSKQEGDQKKDQEQKESQKSEDKDDKKDGSKKEDSAQQDSGKDPKEQQSKSGQDQKDAKDQGDKEGSASQAQEDKSDPKDKGKEGVPRRAMQMTRQEAVQLLDTLRSGEKLLRPPPPPGNRSKRTVKDW